MSTLYVIAYDIPEDRRRNKVAKLLEGYGTRVNYSVFECLLTPAQFARLHARLDRLVRPEEDAVRIYPLPLELRERIVVIGGLKPLEPIRNLIL